MHRSALCRGFLGEEWTRLLGANLQRKIQMRGSVFSWFEGEGVVNSVIKTDITLPLKQSNCHAMNTERM